MLELLLSLVPLAIAATLQPPQVIALIFLLQTPRGVANGLAYVGGMSSLLAYLIFTLLALLLLLIPLILVLAAPGKAQKSLGGLSAWLERHERTTDVIFAILLGVYFLYEGLEHLGVLL